MTLLIQKQCKNEKERTAVILGLEDRGWAVNIESVEDDLDYNEDEECT